ncbi:SCO family protein [Radicibacter daui]|uniref:SCO family protein n=1 Tax=Radicibacter daui TaxID=3064829 RepID=UPI004046F242
MSRTSRLIIIAVVLVLAVALCALILNWQLGGRIASGNGPSIATTGGIGGDFSLTDQNGKPVTQKDYAGSFELIYFGYTFCPDVCPTELLTIAQTLDSLPKATADSIQPVFITIDPERDTQKVMADYVPLFYPRLVGLTGTTDQIAAVAREFRVYYNKVPAKDGDASAYLMDHSSFIYVMGKQGEFLDVIPYGTTKEDMAVKIEQLIQKYGA